MFSFNFNYRKSSKAPPPPLPRWLIYFKPISVGGGGGGEGGLIAIVSVVHKELEYKVEKLKNEMGRGPVSK